MNKLQVLLVLVAAFIITATACSKESSLQAAKDLEAMSAKYDSSGHDSLPPRDSFPHDSFPHDSFPHDTFPHDTFPYPPHDTFPYPPHDTFPPDSVWHRRS